MTYWKISISWTIAHIVELLNSVTAHPDDDKKWPKHVGSMNCENIYHLCILLAFINNYTRVHGVERMKPWEELSCFKFYHLCPLARYFWYVSLVVKGTHVIILGLSWQPCWVRNKHAINRWIWGCFSCFRLLIKTKRKLCHCNWILTSF